MSVSGYRVHFLSVQVLVPKDDSLLGKMFEVVIASTGKHYLKGEVATESLVHAPTRPTPLPHGTISGAKEWREKVTAAETTATDRSTARLDSISSNWLRVSDILLLVVAALVLCAAVLGHYSQLYTVWSR